MDTTTSEDGAIQAQPTTNEAVTTEAPTDAPAQDAPVDDQSTSQAQDQAEGTTADAEQDVSSESQADDITEWAEKKGLPLDDPKKLAQMYRDAEKKMHEATQQKTNIQPPEPLETTGDANYDQLVERQNVQELRTYVRDWFDANPDMKEHRRELEKIATERPWLSNLDDVRAHFLADPNRLESLKSEGGRQALTNLAQKQQQQPPSSGAGSPSSESSKITPQNVDAMVKNMSVEEYQRRLPEINAALQG